MADEVISVVTSMTDSPVENTQTAPSITNDPNADIELNPTTAEKLLEDAAEKLGGKFDSIEELAKAVAELQNTKGGDPESPQTAELPDVGTFEGASAAVDQLKADGLDVQKYFAEFEANGALTEESYAELKKHGIPKEVADKAASTIKAENDAFQKAYTVAGGIEKFNNMKAWASESMTDVQLNTYNELASSGKGEVAVEYLKTLYDANVSTDPDVRLGGSRQKVSMDIPKSITEYYAARAQAKASGDPAKLRKLEDAAAVALKNGYLTWDNSSGGRLF